MRKLILALSIIMLSGSHATTAQTKPAETKASMLNTLRSRIVEEMIKDGKSKEKAEKFGDCLSKDLGAKLTLEELKMFHQLNTAKGGPSKELIQKAEKMGLKKKLQNVGKNCERILE